MRFRFIVTVLLASVLIVAGIRWGRAQQSRGGTLASLGASVRAVEPDTIPAFLRSLRPVLPYSVLPGGVFSADELRRRLQTDRVARQHYAGFDTNRTWLVSLPDDRLQYVSYRKGDAVFWTKKRLLIPRGEILITDGRNFARTRCGNLLSDTPHSNVLEKEPTAAISIPPVTPESLHNSRIAFNSPPEIPVAVDYPDLDRHLQDLLLAPGPVSKSGSDRLSAPFSGMPGVYFSGAVGGQANKKQAGDSTTPATPTGSNNQIPPPVMLIPEPRFVVPVAIAFVWLLLRARVIRRRTQPMTQC